VIQPCLIAGNIQKMNELIAANDMKKQVGFVIHSVDQKYASKYCPFMWNEWLITATKTHDLFCYLWLVANKW
jgi:hypothetical protein